MAKEVATMSIPDSVFGKALQASKVTYTRN